MQLISIEKTSKSIAKNSAVIGVDLGTTHSVVAFSEGQKARVLPLFPEAPNTDLLPTLLTNDSQGLHLASQGFPLQIENFKRFMDTPDTPIFQHFTPLDLSALVLKELKTRTEKYLSKTVSGVVITVPAHFSDIARKATKLAAKQAGLTVIRLLNEPTAAALAYGLQNRPSNGVYLVYDFGGGTFDVTILRIENGVFQVLASTGSLHLGGQDIDRAFLKSVGLSTPTIEQRLVAQAIKEQGWTPHNALNLSQQDFQTITHYYFEQTAQIMNRALTDLQLVPAQIDFVILVGGSTRLDAVYQGVSALFGPSKILQDIDPDRAVAMGAALHAEALVDPSNEASRPLLLDIIPASLGIETAMGIVENIVPQYTPTPVRVQTPFSTFYDHQTEVLIHVVQGNNLLVSECTSLGRFVLHGIPSLPGGKPKILITFKIDEDGLLTVTACEETSGIQKQLVIESCVKKSA